MAKKDLNQLAKSIVDIVTGALEDPNFKKKLTDAQTRGRNGGLKGGPARTQTLTSEIRKEIAQKAAKKRWGSND